MVWSPRPHKGAMTATPIALGWNGRETERTEACVFHIDWHDIFGIDTPPIELIIRGTAVYLSLFVLLRVVLRRQSSAIGVTDLLVVVLLADAAQNAMAGSYNSVPEGLVLVGTIVFWAFALDWLGFKVSRIQSFVHPPALLLVKDGKLLRKNMRRELITEEELMSQLRIQGLTGLDEVEEARMESDGSISIISRDHEKRHQPEQRQIV